jgi:hypothetical protein
MRRPVVQTRGTLGSNKVSVLDEGVSTTLTARVLGLMRSDILELRLAPGSKLVLEELRDKYEAGASPLRESLSRLEVEGLVIGEDRRGFHNAAQGDRGLGGNPLGPARERHVGSRSGPLFPSHVTGDFRIAQHVAGMVRAASGLP